MPKPLTIGVFDSGFGGLTVLRALLPLLPGTRFLYLGDTARLPYGSKSRETIASYALSSCNFLLQQGADLLVIACNTATALALDHLQAHLPIPVLGVIEPGAQAALAAAQTAAQTAPNAGAPGLDSQTWVSPSHNDPRPNRVPGAPGLDPQTWAPPSHNDLRSTPHVLVLATAATVQSHAYTHALHALGLQSTEKACPLLVPLVEEGWLPDPSSTQTRPQASTQSSTQTSTQTDTHTSTHPTAPPHTEPNSQPSTHPSPQSLVTAQVLRIYLAEAQALAPAATALLLGCTHYPILEPLLRQTLQHLHYPLTIIDSAEATARATHRLVTQRFPDHPRAPQTSTTFFATDSIAKFQRLGSRFLGQPLPQVHLINLGG